MFAQLQRIARIFESLNVDIKVIILSRQLKFMSSKTSFLLA